MKSRLHRLLFMGAFLCLLCIFVANSIATDYLPMTLEAILRCNSRLISSGLRFASTIVNP